MPNGAPSGGAPARKESSRLVLLRPACGSQTDHRSGSGTRVSNICLGTRLGSSANTGCRDFFHLLVSLPAKTDLRTLANHHQGALGLRSDARIVENGF